jgi:hypothetical protein
MLPLPPPAAPREDKKKSILIMMSNTGGGHKASAEAIKQAFHELYGDEYAVGGRPAGVAHIQCPCSLTACHCCTEHPVPAPAGLVQCNTVAAMSQQLLRSPLCCWHL